MKKVLIIDDNLEIRTLLRMVLSKHYLIFESSNADDAYIMINSQMPDAIVLDVMMPGTMDGMKLCQKLRHEDGLWMLPIIMLTARAQEKDRFQGVTAGVDTYMTKPFSPIKLLYELESLLGDRHQ